ncbi:MAG: hypothetical protein M3N30_13810 [Bacteroidota bacterium]|nr:hypothetical protein [Bacteroidota bacterium]
MTSIVLIIASFYFLSTTFKSKAEFVSVRGSVEFISMKYGDLPNRDYSKYRYLKINRYSRPFELFVGKEGGDFSPDLDKIDSLKMGDIITVYYDYNYKTAPEPVNRLTYFIDRGAEPVFIFSHSLRQMAWILIGLSLTCLIVVIVYNQKQKNLPRH